ncbi:MAG: NAD(P)/FAD-dependent oxidoreductase [Proteobacteria bacterium]|nr:NAD(P)/FAD-dependent oxidoreductase [Pseudomonadota bacterium]
MSAPRSYDAIVIGGGTSGLVAAAYLAKARRKVLLLEAQDKFGGLCAPVNLGAGFSATGGAHMLYALDPLVMRDLKLARKGLRFEGREIALTGLRSDGKHIVIHRDIHDTAASLAVHSQRDAETWPRFRKELFDLARAMRSLWWESHGAMPSGGKRQKLDRIARVSAAAWLGSWFEGEALKGTLCFDAVAGGVSVLEPGSALALVWRAAQEMLGLQGAVAIPQGGLIALVDSLVSVATEAGCELRTGARVKSLIPDQGRVVGVRIETGETCFAPMVLSAVSCRQTLSDLLPNGACGIARQAVEIRNASVLGEASLLFTLRSVPPFGGVSVPTACRFILAEKPETYVSAEMAAREGRLGDELPVAFVVPTLSDPSLAPPGQHILSALIRPVPRRPVENWSTLKAELARRVAGEIEKLAPGFSRAISHIEILSPDDIDDGYPVTVPRMLSNAAQRIEAPVAGLFLCGADAEPVPAISGRAARIAASLALAGQP